jgi:hypothetical protein
LPDKYIPNDWSLQQTNYEFKRYSKTNGEVFCISGCQDTQTSADAFMEGKAAGVLSFLLLKCLRDNSHSTTYKWKHLLKDICCGEKVYRFTQRTALTSGNPLNLEDSVFVSSPTQSSKIYSRSIGDVAPIPMTSLPRNLNYNPLIKKLYISYN